MSYVVHSTRRSVIVSQPNPDRLLAAVPSAREVNYRGARLVAVPHNVWETQRLRGAGEAVPSPIGYYYDWTRQKRAIPAPFDNQIETAAFLTLYPRAYCLNEIGTGKTMAALWAADYLMKQGVIRKALITAPLSTLERVWGDAIFEHFPHRSIGVLYGSAERRRKIFANSNFDFYVINHDALDIVCDVKREISRGKSVDPVTGEVKTYDTGEKVVGARLKRDDIDLWIPDELATYRAPSTSRFKIAKFATKDTRWVWGLTGTPMPNSPVDAWAQCSLVTPWTIPWSYTAFQSSVMDKHSDYISTPRAEAVDIVYRAMSPGIRFTRDQCFDLPECLTVERTVELTEPQRKHYREIAKSLYTEIDGGKITALNEAIKAGKLLQIALGMVYDTDGTPRPVDASPRVKVVEELIDQSSHKVIVFVPFRAPLVELAKALEKIYKGQVAIVHGEVSAGNRNRIFADFQNCRTPRILVADAGCMSHGLTLTESNTIIWYGPEWSNDTYTQANGRITRPGQVNKQYIVHISGTEIERKMYRRLKERGRMQGLLLDMVRKNEL